MYKLSVFVVAVAILGVGLAALVDKPMALESARLAIQRVSNATRPPCTIKGNTNLIYNGLRDKRYSWKNFYLQLDWAFDPNEVQAISSAMYQLSQVLPYVNFGIWSPDSRPSGDYIYIKKRTNKGCASYIGRIGGMQEIDLQSPGCMSMGTILHEMMHTLGMGHEHSRADRDQYITVNFGNILSGFEFNFEKLRDNMYSTFGVPYKQNSIMHYTSYVFSRNGRPTIVAKNGQPVGPYNDKLTDTDILKLKGCTIANDTINVLNLKFV